jgi:holo-[acyl-carrier protein] synthase
LDASLTVRLSAGVDLVEVGRLSRLASDETALAHLLTERELAYCRRGPRPAEHIAARFAAKEAVLKALGTGRSRGIRWTDVEILRERGGRPVVRLHGRAAALAVAGGLDHIDVSLSHTQALAIAHVVATWDSPVPSLCQTPEESHSWRNHPSPSTISS